MKKSVLILCILGFASLVVGSVLATSSIRSKLPTMSIPSHGIIRNPDELPSQEADAPLTQQTSDETSLDKIGYFTILGSMGFFTAGFMINRKRN